MDIAVSGGAMPSSLAQKRSAVLWLGDPGSTDAARVGGKAAGLGKLAVLFPVPPGFCLPAETIATVIGDGTARDELIEIVSPAYARLAERTATLRPIVAVRSSAVDEDGAAASFAGQHETYLNLSGPDAIAEAVLRCWDSSRSERALAYRRELGLATDDVQLAVLVQQLIRADASAVVFSANPINGSRDEIVVTATIGLGESLVGGTVTPDTWVLDKANLAVLDERIGDKRRMTVPTESGTREVDIPRMLRQLPSLAAPQLTELGHLARALEQLMGWPVDIEVAFGAGKLALLQCRPITSGLMAPLGGQADPKP